MAFLMYIFAIIFVQAATSYIDKDDRQALEMVSTHFGSVSTAMFSLLLSISNGIQWDLLAEELNVISPIMKSLFAVYVMFVLFGFLNVVTGVFVHNTSQVKLHDRDLAIQEEMLLAEHFVTELRSFFDVFDFKPDAQIERDVLRTKLQRFDLQMYLQTHQIDSNEAMALFDLLDVDNDGTIAIDDFVYGCLRIKGQAKAMDIVLLFEEVQQNQAYIQKEYRRQVSSSREYAVWQEQVLKEVAEVRADLLEIRELIHPPTAIIH